MNLYKMKDSSNASSYPRTLYSIIVSVGLLAMFITFASWVLLSYPISTAVRNYFYGVNGIGDMNSPASWQITALSEVNSTEKSIVDLQQLKDREGVDVNREDGNKEISEEKPSEIRNNEKITPGINWQNTTPSEVNNSENATIGIPENLDVHRDANREDEKKDPVQQLKNRDGVDANQEDEKKESADEKSSEIKNDEKITPGISEQNMTPSEVNSSENATAGISESLDVQHSKDKEGLGEKDEDNKKVNGEPSEVSNNENTTQGVNNENTTMKDAGTVDMNQENKDKQMVDDGKSDQSISEDTLKNDTTYNNPSPPLKGECDLFHGEWFYDEAGPLYTNNSCPVITQMQNCQGNGRPDKGYENWRWRPSHCELPRFDAYKFLELMSGKTLAFVGDSVARNQMESLLCILWQVEAPKNRGNRHMQRWYFRSKSVMIVRIWSSWLVHQSGAPFKDVPEGVAKVFLDVPDETFMQYVPGFDVVVLSSGHWFAKQSAYIKNNEIVGTQLWSPPNGQQSQVNNVEAFGVSSETAMAALATNPNFTGIAILRSFSPDHYEGGAWNTGGSCTGKVEPARPGQLVENGFTNVMYEKQVNGFNLGVKKQTNGAKLRLMDITEVFSYRHDGHPGPFRSTDPNKITKRGPDGRPPPQDCLHWCMPGPVDTWNELVLEIIRREYEK